MRHRDRALSGWLVLLLFIVPPLFAQAEPPVRLSETARARALSQIQALSSEKEARSPALKKVSSQLIYAERMLRGVEVAPGVAAIPGAFRLMTLDAGRRAEVEVKTFPGAVNDALLSALATRGAAVVRAYPKYNSVTAWIALSSLEKVAELPGVRFIAPTQLPMVNREHRLQLTQDLVNGVQLNTIPTTEGDHAHAADTMRTSTGASGSGVKIGVISDGVSSLTAEQTAGALPTVTVLPGQGGPAGHDEGTAMLEIVHTLAPSAQLFFATSGNTEAQMATNIEGLQTAGCTVIIDDVTFFDEGAFQDGTIEQAVSTVAALGVLYFSSASNSGNLTDNTSGTWEGDYVAGTPELAGLGVEHSFGTDGLGHAETFNGLTNSSGVISLKWSDPLGASGNDYDLYIVDSGGGVITSSTDTQAGSGDPFELASYNNAIAPAFVVVVNAGPGRNGLAAARALRVDTNRSQLQFATSGATFGHNAGGDAFSVAAVSVSTAGGGVFTGGATNPVETYSSDGLRRMFYAPNGTALTPGNVLFGTKGGVLLRKPDLAAADCVSVHLATFDPFCGTSAAAPHAGAIAALGLSMVVQTLSPQPAQVASEFRGVASLDIMATGFDRDSGNGIVMANRMAHDLTVSVPPHGFFTVPPCRIFDTRNPAGPLGGPALGAHGTRGFDLLAATCGVDAAATSLAVNVTVTQPAALGDLRIYPADALGVPTATTINFVAGQTVANNAVLLLPLTASGVVNVLNDAAGSVQVIVDVVGYFK